MSRIEILKIDSLIYVWVSIFKIKLLHIDLIDFKFNLFDIFCSDCKDDIILRFEELLSFLSNYGDLFGFFKFLNLIFGKYIIDIRNLFTLLKFNLSIETINDIKLKIST